MALSFQLVINKSQYKLKCYNTASVRQMMQNKRNSMLSRRDFLRLAGIGSAAMLLKACTPKLVSPAKGSGKASLPTVTPSPTVPPTASHASAPTQTSTPRKLCFVLWDHQLARYNFRPRNIVNPVPETCPLYSGAKNPVTPAWEAYWKGLLHLCNPTMSDVEFEHAWSSLVDSHRAFTNASGPKTGDFMIHSLTCGGATHEMVTGEPYGLYMEIYTLNSQKEPPSIPAKPEDIDMTRHFFATTGSNVKLPDGSYAVYGFPQFENCIIPLLGPSNSDMIEISRIKAVASIQRPYNP
jgi:hypothetical protein